MCGRSFKVMDDILFERFMPHGPAVRVRRTSDVGAVPVTVVLEVDRRAGTPREGIGTPPPLMQCEAATEPEALALLEPHARDDRTLVQLMHQMGLR
jgi:hypothetical protein